MTASSDLKRPDTAVYYLGSLQANTGYRARTLHVGEQIRPAIGRLISTYDWNVNLRNERSAGNLLLEYARIKFLSFPSPEAESKLGEAVVSVDHPTDKPYLAVVGINFADNRFEPRPGATSIFSVVVDRSNRDSKNFINGLLRDVMASPATCTEEMHAQFGPALPAELQIGSLAIFDPDHRRYIRRSIGS